MGQLVLSRLLTMKKLLTLLPLLFPSPCPSRHVRPIPRLMLHQSPSRENSPILKIIITSMYESSARAITARYVGASTEQQDNAVLSRPFTRASRPLSRQLYTGR